MLGSGHLVPVQGGQQGQEEACPGADHHGTSGGGSCTSEREDGGRGGAPAGDQRADVLPVAEGVRGDEGGPGTPREGARAGECTAEASGGEPDAGQAVIMYFLHNPHSYALVAQQYTGPYVTRIGLYNHTLASSTGSWWPSISTYFLRNSGQSSRPEKYFCKSSCLIRVYGFAHSSPPLSRLI